MIYRSAADNDLGISKGSLVRAANIALVLLALLFSINLLRLLLAHQPIVSTQLAARSVSADSNSKWAWFVASQEQAGTKKELEKSQLSARVLGVLGGGDNAVATIQLSNRPEKVYRVGENLTASAKLVSIHVNRIVIIEDGEFFELPLEKMGRPNSNLLTRNSSSENTLQSASLQLTGMARAIPVSIDGQTGLKLEDLATDIIDLSDLKTNDVIMSVEGQNIENLMANNNWQKLLSKTDARVRLVRDGQSMDVQINVATLAQQMAQSMLQAPRDN